MTINRKKEKEKGTLNETMSPTNDDDDDDDDESVFIHLILTGASGYLGQHLLAHWIETGLPQYYRKKTNKNHVHITALYNTFDGFPDAVKQFQDNLLSGGRDGNAEILDVTVHVQAMDISDPDKNNAFEILMDRITALPQTTTNDDDDDDNDGALQNSSTSSTTTTTCVIVIHTAAISSPKYCEDHPKQAYTDNVPTHFLERIIMMGQNESSSSSSPSSTPLTPVAATTNKQHKLVPSIIALSTDQVYDGKAKTFIMDNNDDTTPATGNWYKEEEEYAVNPVNVYGQTKLELEQYLIKKSLALSTRNSNSNLFFALRSSIIFGPNLVPILSSSTSSASSASSTSSTSSSSSAAAAAVATPATATPLTSSSTKKRTKTVHTTFLDFVRSRGQQNLATTYYTNEYRTVIRVDDIQNIINDIITKHIIPTTVATSIVDTTSNYDNSSTSTSTSTSSMLMISSPPPVVFNMGGPYRVNRMDLAEAVFRYYGYDTQLLVPTEQTSSLSPKDISMDSSLLLHYGFGNKKMTTMIKSLTKKANSSSNNNSTCSRDDGKGVHKNKEEEENMDHDHKNNNNNSKKSKLSKQEEYLDKLVRYVFS